VDLVGACVTEVVLSGGVAAVRDVEWVFVGGGEFWVHSLSVKTLLRLYKHPVSTLIFVFGVKSRHLVLDTRNH
jgi:hypothetical protein